MSSSSATVSSAPVTSTQVRPGLALLAGALGVPGSTLAWDLPHGGLWIGVPLAIVATVLGLMAYSYVEGRRRWMAVGAIVLGMAELLFIAGCYAFA
jgi:hypothetical protein